MKAVDKRDEALCGLVTRELIGDRVNAVVWDSIGSGWVRLYDYRTLEVFGSVRPDYSNPSTEWNSFRKRFTAVRNPFTAGEQVFSARQVEQTFESIGDAKAWVERWAVEVLSQRTEAK